MDTTATSPAITALSLLVDWANTQDAWVRALVSEVIQTRKEIGDDAIARFYDLLLREKELKPGDAVAIPTLEFEADGGDQEETFLLKRIDDVQNVNLLAPGQDIAFNDRLTVLFGENATGKTGYVRILKRIASVRTAELILPDITKPGSPPPQAAITYRLGAEEPTIQWNDDAGLHPFTRIDVFDARSVVLHVDQELSYVYTPSDLSLFRLVHEAIDRVREKLNQARTKALPKGNPYLAKFSRETSIYAKIESLGSSTDIGELENLAVVSEAEEAGLDSLREKVDALRSKMIDARLEVASTEHDLYKKLLHAATVLDGFDGDAYAAALVTLKQAEQTHTRATEEAFADESIPGALGDTWTAFIEAGEEHLRDLEANDYPTEGDPCIYCRQALGEAAVSLLRKYRGLCNDANKQAIGQARDARDELTVDVLALDLQRLKDDFDKKVAAIAEPDERPDVLTTAAAFTAIALRLRQALSEGRAFEDDSLVSLTTEARRLTEGHTKNLDGLIKDLTEQAKNRQEALDRESAKLRELEARITLRELLPQIKEHVEAAKWANKAKIILSRFTSIGRSLTDQSKIASEQLLNHDFERLFISECKALKAPKVTLDFPGRRGQPVRRKSLAPNHNLSEILSEGEQKVIALADFIAEASLKPKAAPLVLDDPVTSLDYKRLQHLVDRLVEISRSRQVIVFTHNIWFTMELLGRFEDDRNSCSYFDVSEAGGQRGFISRGTHPRADTYKTLKGRINTLIQEAGAAQPGETQNALIEKGYELIRAICEVIVETDLLQSVTQRYQPNVMMTRLPRIKADRLSDAIAVVMPLFDKACRYIASHSQPLETLSIRPTVDEFEEDWIRLQAARDAYIKD